MAKKSEIPLVLHCVVIHTNRGPLTISLSKVFDITADDLRIQIRASSLPAVPATLQHGIGSLHTLFGANGSGKTSILLQLAEGMAADGENDISALFQHGSSLYLHTAPAWHDLKLDADVAVVRTDQAPGLFSAFYTSSPYEYGRRRERLEAAGCVDVSPHYTRDNRLDGLSLLATLQRLPGDFIKGARMGIGPNLLSYADIYERLDEAQLGTKTQFEAGSDLRYILYKNQTLLSKESLQLRILCTIADYSPATSTLAKTWPMQVAQLLLKAVRASHQTTEEHDLSKLIKDFSSHKHKRIVTSTIIGLSKLVAELHPSLTGLVKTMETLFRLVKDRRRKSVEALPPTFSANLDKFFPDKEHLRRCSELGLAVFSVHRLSSGETALAVLCAALHGALKKLEQAVDRRDPFLLLIDEGEMFLHPKWQRIYIGKILELVQSFSDLAPRTHIVVSSHSLVIAADTPPHCLVDIDTLKTVNGFGLGPNSLLEQVYHIDELSGGYTNGALASLAQYFGTGGQKITKEQALLTATALADPNIRDYFVKRIAEHVTP